MSEQQPNAKYAYIPFVYEMAMSFFDSAPEAIDLLLQTLDAYNYCTETDEHGHDAAQQGVQTRSGSTVSDRGGFHDGTIECRAEYISTVETRFGCSAG